MPNENEWRGTPDAPKSEAFFLIIPASVCYRGALVVVAVNPNAKWNIRGVPSGWCKPGMASTDEAYANANSWNTSEPNALVDYVYEKGGELTQILPLAGQEVGVPADTPYEYRARAVTLKESEEVLYCSGATRAPCLRKRRAYGT